MICVFRGRGGGTVEFQPWFCSFCPDRSSHWWPWAHRWSRAQLKVFPHLNVTPVPELWPTWKAQEMKEEKFTSSTYSIPFQDPGSIYVLYLCPPSHRQGKLHWENSALGVSGSGDWCLGVLLGKGTEEAAVSFYPSESPLTEYSCKSGTPRAQIQGWQL